MVVTMMMDVIIIMVVGGNVVIQIFDGEGYFLDFV